MLKQYKCVNEQNGDTFPKFEGVAFKLTKQILLFHYLCEEREFARKLQVC